MLDAVADRIAGIDPRLGAMALALHLGNHLLRSLAWRNAIAAAYPERRVPYGRVLAGYAGGVADEAIMRVVIREGFSYDLADDLLAALRSATDYLTANPPRISTAPHGFSHT